MTTRLVYAGVVTEPPRTSVKSAPVRKGPARCSCGRFVSRGGRCSQERKVYREGSFAGWEHP